MKHQTGYVWRVGRSWFGRWYQDEIEDGAIVRRQHAEKLCEYSDRYRSKKDVRPLIDDKLAAANQGSARPEGTLPIGRYVEECFLPYVEQHLKPSTINGYRHLWAKYLKLQISKIVNRDFRCVDASRALEAIYERRKLSSITLRHCKGLMSAIFTHAKQEGAIDGLNPVQDARIPHEAKKGHITHAYTPQDVSTMLQKLNGPARAAIALMYFAGLRPGEARAVRWSDYDAEKKILRISASAWRTHVTLPKTEESKNIPVPVARALAAILDELPRSSEFILPAPKGRPLDLHNLAARVVAPALKRCALCHKQETDHAKADHDFELDKSIPEWRGWYALRRGTATTATSLDSDIAAKGLLRHRNISVTQQHYIKDVPADAKRVVDKMDLLFDNAAVGTPN